MPNMYREQAANLGLSAQQMEGHEWEDRIVAPYETGYVGQKTIEYLARRPGHVTVQQAMDNIRGLNGSQIEALELGLSREQMHGHTWVSLYSESYIGQATVNYLKNRPADVTVQQAMDNIRGLSTGCEIEAMTLGLNRRQIEGHDWSNRRGSYSGPLTVEYLKNRPADVTVQQAMDNIRGFNGDIRVFVDARQYNRVQAVAVAPQAVLNKESKEAKEVKSKPVPEALNGTQKNIIEGTLSFPLGSIAELKPAYAIKAFQAITSKNIPLSDIETFKQQGVWDDIKGIRDILAHPHPQNRSTGNSSVGQEPGMAVWFVGDFPPTADRIRKEPVGLLSLTSRNDKTTPPVTKDAVVNYITQLVGKEIDKQKEKQAAHEAIEVGGSPLVNASEQKSWTDAMQRQSKSKDSGVNHPW